MISTTLLLLSSPSAASPDLTSSGSIHDHNTAPICSSYLNSMVPFGTREFFFLGSCRNGSNQVKLFPAKILANIGHSNVYNITHSSLRRTRTEIMLDLGNWRLIRTTTVTTSKRTMLQFANNKSYFGSPLIGGPESPAFAY